ncbi:autotransporter outer membrane beta-barrel domain-containing protein, partial [Candidatus Pelagibacter sp.]|nr:autotransporter outer membrane beta-barrel domain-containing protein [Candidatus Pelagibacter sp.]
MFLFKRILIIFFFIIPISNSWGIISDEVQNALFVDSNNAQTNVRGLAFSPDGLKVFLHYQNGGDTFRYIAEYKLSTPFDISTKTYAGDSERCELTGNSGGDRRIFDMSFSTDGLKLFIARAGANNEAGSNIDNIFRYDLTSPYDISTCSFAQKTTDLDGDTLQLNSQAGNRANDRHNKAQGVAINNDGTKIFIIFQDAADERILEYNLSTPYDLETISLVTSAGITLPVDGNPMSLFFNSTGTRLFYHDHNNHTVTQISLGAAYDTSSFTVDGSVDIRTKASASNISSELGGLAFSKNGLMIFLANDTNDNTGDRVLQFNVSCPFNIIAGKCPPVTENSVRTGIAEAQIMIAKRTIDHSTKSALNRLQWIRRNKDNQNLTNLNIDFNFNTATQIDNPLLNYWVKKLPDRILSINEKVEGGQSITINKEDMNSKNSNNFTTVFKSDNPMLNSWLSKIPDKITAHQASIKKKTEEKQQDIFYWSEGSIAVGRVGDTNISSFKKIGTEAITLGADKFTDNNGIKGLAFRLGNNNVEVGMGESNIDTDTFNLTYYSTTPLENDTKFEDIVIGFGKLKYDILTVSDGKHIKATRDGRQVYFTNKFKDEIKKDNFTLIPSFQADVGYTKLDRYTESGIGAIKVKDQNIQTLKLRTTMGVVEDLPNESTFCLELAKTCAIKRHGKIEYMADLSRSSNFEYTYASDSAVDFQERLYSGALHNVNGEMGIDIILPDSFSVFLIYERNQALGTGYTDNINITIGYLPNKKTNYAFKVAGSDNLGSEYKISKNI